MEKETLTRVSVDLKMLFTDTITSSLKNIASILGAVVLWLITIWIPYINVGTTIAVFYGLPLELSRGLVFNPLSIFDVKYRKFMGEFFALLGLYYLSIVPAVLFMIIPGIIIAVGWSFAFLLLIDRECDPSRCLTDSTRYTFGYKWLIFLGELVLIICVLILFSIIGAIFQNVSGLNVLVIFAYIVFLIGLTLAFKGQLYRRLVVEREEKNGEEV
jgi:hypothetical protein